MGVLYLVRHAQANVEAYGPGSRTSGVGGLTELGREQARLAGRALGERGGTIRHAIAGDLARQQETLDIVLSAAGAAPQMTEDARWNEYDMRGLVGDDAVTRSGADLQRVVDSALDQWVTGGAVGVAEPYSAYTRRCADALDAAQSLAGSGSSVVVVSSSGTISQVLAQVLGIAAGGWIRLSRTMVNASTSKLIVGRSGVSAVSMNEHSYLESGGVGFATYR
ncbi:histidine phosphatase family protein [Gordonia sp. LSe1-13]|uniref:Histidine phosphatase family protein n=1 Tax=Gordonia sesuvii TaxID=3116777 RepID=A0ABU7MIW0_9ACTN|nr:histidine phosphatase family protein [Gordonia sp. LSe1-13]